MFIGARDQARLGLLVARSGDWGGRQILPESWVDGHADTLADQSELRLSVVAQRGAARIPRARRTRACFALGAGTNLIWIDPEHDLVAVLRWIDKTKIDGFFSRLMGSLR